MGFRDAPGHVLTRRNTELPDFSNFEFVDENYRSHSILRRILSLARTQGYRSLLIEQIRSEDCSLLAEEDEALARRLPKFKGSEVNRLSFFASPEDTDPSPDDFLGYAIIKRDFIGAEESEYIYECVLRAAPGRNRYIHTRRPFSVHTDLGDFEVTGVLYAQQNAHTFVCAHVALRTALSCLLPEGDCTYSKMNELAGVDHVRKRVGKGHRGLLTREIKAILGGLNLSFDRLIHEPDRKAMPRDQEYQRSLYAAIESACPALLGFQGIPEEVNGSATGGGQKPRAPRHLIPVIGHTFNDDAWVPAAERVYFKRDGGYFSSETWLSSFVIHDDNFGPYHCLPRHYLQRSSFRLLYTLKSFPTSLGPIQAETLAYSQLCDLVKKAPYTSIAWYDRFAAFSRANLLILRTFLLSRSHYLDHLHALRDRQRQERGFNEALVRRLEKSLPPNVWMAEVSAPELFQVSRMKFGEVLLDPNTDAKSKKIPPLFIRLPGMTLEGLTPNWNAPVRSYTPLYAHTT